jgi:hypothetical protein
MGQRLGKAEVALVLKQKARAAKPFQRVGQTWRGVPEQCFHLLRRLRQIGAVELIVQMIGHTGIFRADQGRIQGQFDKDMGQKEYPAERPDKGRIGEQTAGLRSGRLENGRTMERAVAGKMQSHAAHKGRRRRGGFTGDVARAQPAPRARSVGRGIRSGSTLPKKNAGDASSLPATSRAT